DVGKVTGGGQVVPNAGGIASFGFVAERQTLAGPTTGHFNYLNHSTGLNVNGPVTLLIVDGPTTATFQGSGTCNLTPCTFVVSVEDGGEPGRNRDKLQVSIAPNSPAEVGPPKRTISRGNIQVHKSPSGNSQSEMAVTGAGEGVFPAGALYEGVFLDSATLGLGATIASAETAEGQFQTTLTGVSALGLKRLIQMEGIAISGSSGPADTATFSGTCSVDIGDGTPPLLDVPFTVVVVTNTDGKGSLTLTLGTIDLPAAAINEGSVKIK
ncbi:MAG TPA: post-COAP-1 domain-containing protein, partial [Candidatus Polarisedimenticolia bacterium]|nr:post-COAP-1 domain-containing protein [Candidatus Polarisedimenticolia bacterium]